MVLVQTVDESPGAEWHVAETGSYAGDFDKAPKAKAGLTIHLVFLTD